MKKLYDLIGLTPYRSVLLHLLLIGIPFRFGLLPAGWGPEWLHTEPCSMFHSKHAQCSATELLFVQDFGVRYLLFYNLACVVGFMTTTNHSTTSSTSVALHQVLLGTSVGVLVVLAYMQPELISGRREPLNTDFSFHWGFCYCLACSVSLWTIVVHPKPVTESVVKWSIPANAIFLGGVINLLVAVASMQAFMKQSGVEQYCRDLPVLTPAIRFSFTMGAVYTMMHAMVLLRIRTFMNVSQLRVVCLYKLLVNMVLPILWMPERNPLVLVNRLLVYAIRASITLTYLFGFLFAGKAEGVSRMLASEKED